MAPGKRKFLRRLISKNEPGILKNQLFFEREGDEREKAPKADTYVFWLI
jgi:hypothetical protein